MTATERSKARYKRASAVLAKITLDIETADALALCREAHKVSAAVIVRRLLLDEASRIRAQASSS